MNAAEIKKYLIDASDKTVEKALAILEVEGVKSIIKNFEEEGRPVKWKKSQKSEKYKNTKILYQRGALKLINAVSDKEKKMVIISTNPLAKAYARIHQEGGIINMPSQNLRFRRKKNNSGANRTVFASKKHKKIIMEKHLKPYTIKIEPRPYMVIPDEDLKKIMEAINNAI